MTGWTNRYLEQRTLRGWSQVRMDWRMQVQEYPQVDEQRTGKLEGIQLEKISADEKRSYQVLDKHGRGRIEL